MDRDWWEQKGPDGRTFAQRLLALREAEGLRQKDVDLGPDTNPRTVVNNLVRWEKGNSIKLHHAIALARFFDVSLHWLLTGEGARDPKEGAESEAKLAAIEAIVSGEVDPGDVTKGRVSPPTSEEVVAEGTPPTEGSGGTRADGTEGGEG